MGFTSGVRARSASRAPLQRIPPALACKGSQSVKPNTHLISFVALAIRNNIMILQKSLDINRQILNPWLLLLHQKRSDAELHRMSCWPNPTCFSKLVQHSTVTWGYVLSSKWDKFIFPRPAFVPSACRVADHTRKRWGVLLSTCSSSEVAR